MIEERPEGWEVSIVTAWRQRFDKVRADEAIAKSKRRDVAYESEPSAKDKLRSFLNTRDLPLEIALGFKDAIDKAREEDLPAIERVLRERGREWTGKPKRSQPLNRVRRSA